VIVPNLSSSRIQDLIDRLSAGEDKHLFSPDAWAARLGNDVAAEQFVEQMREEWLPVDSVSDPLCQAMLEFGRTYLSNRHSSWPHHWAHALRVTGTALMLAPEAGIEPSHAFMLGIFHDLGKLEEILSDGEVSHEEIGAWLVRNQAWTHFSDQTITLLANVVAKKSHPSNPYTRLLHNADKLDKIGATGIARRLSTSFGVKYPDMALRRVRSDLESFPAMYFPTSRRMADLKKDFTESFLALLQKDRRN